MAVASYENVYGIVMSKRSFFIQAPGNIRFEAI